MTTRRCAPRGILVLPPQFRRAICPVGGPHFADTSVEYQAPPFWGVTALQAEGAPDLTRSGNTPWPGNSTTPWLYWYDQSPAAFYLHVRP